PIAALIADDFTEAPHQAFGKEPSHLELLRQPRILPASRLLELGIGQHLLRSCDGLPHEIPPCEGLRLCLQHVESLEGGGLPNAHLVRSGSRSLDVVYAIDLTD